MTHPATIETLIGLRARRTSKGDAYAAEASELYARAAAATATAADFLSQAADFSGFLRTADLENAADYPDPRTPASTAVAELRAIADLIERIGLPEAGLGVGIELNIHNVKAATAEAFAAKVSAALADAEITRRDRYIEVAYNSDAPGVSVEYSLYLTREPEPEPQARFVKATPAEVAEAYAAPMPYIDLETLRNVVVAGTEQRAALLEEHAADVAAADELERQGGQLDAAAEESGPFWPGVNPGELDPVDDDGEADTTRRMDALDDASRAEDAAARRLDQADADAYQDYLGDQDGPLDDAPADTEPDAPVVDRARIPVGEGDRVQIVRGKYQGNFGLLGGRFGGLRRVALEDGRTADVTRASIMAAPLDADGNGPEDEA